MGDKAAWVAHKYAEQFDKFKDFEDNAERIHVKDVSCLQFIDRFEKSYKPVVIEGVQVNIIIILDLVNVLVFMYEHFRMIGKLYKNGQWTV